MVRALQLTLVLALSIAAACGPVVENAGNNTSTAEEELDIVRMSLPKSLDAELSGWLGLAVTDHSVLEAAKIRKYWIFVGELKAERYSRNSSGDDGTSYFAGAAVNNGGTWRLEGGLTGPLFTETHPASEPPPFKEMPRSGSGRMTLVSILATDRSAFAGFVDPQIDRVDLLSPAGEVIDSFEPGRKGAVIVDGVGRLVGYRGTEAIPLRQTR